MTRLFVVQFNGEDTFMGNSDAVICFEYSFVLPKGQFRTIKGTRLAEMLSGVWAVRPPGEPA